MGNNGKDYKQRNEKIQAKLYKPFNCDCASLRKRLVQLANNSVKIYNFFFFKFQFRE